MNYLIAALMALAIAWSLMVLHLVTVNREEAKPVKTFNELVGPQHCRAAADVWGCLTYE